MWTCGGTIYFAMVDTSDGLTRKYYIKRMRQEIGTLKPGKREYILKILSNDRTE
jgi:hypothetical protein